jgi:hypothetical protein
MTRVATETNINRDELSTDLRVRLLGPAIVVIVLVAAR